MKYCQGNCPFPILGTVSEIGLDKRKKSEKKMCKLIVD